MEKTIFIGRNFDASLTLVYYDSAGTRVRELYYGYSKQAAIKDFRQKHNLKGKHLDIVDLGR